MPIIKSAEVSKYVTDGSRFVHLEEERSFDHEQLLLVGNVGGAFNAIPSCPSLHHPSPLPSLVFGSPSPTLQCTKS
ncbi:uncharacterized protein ARMOST_13611 [Armillaria ostoyae]|uniref:Uncharacterized protein n=1 Tax=Armillaria ostoyae TaxID=47428 RepID=A0A284RN91_ARMOS|nr:uncharacterized protein ARMOST_13611 [Armillaria ostoyae]